MPEKSHRQPKQLATYRLPPEFKAAIRAEAKALGMTQAEFLEQCFLRFREAVRKRKAEERAALELEALKHLDALKQRRAIS